MQQVTIQPVGIQAGKKLTVDRLRSFQTGRHCQKQFGDKKNFVSESFNRLADDLFGVAIHFCRIDVLDAELDTPTQSPDNGSPIGRIDFPGPLTDDRDQTCDVTEAAKFHALRMILILHTEFDALWIFSGLREVLQRVDEDLLLSSHYEPTMYTYRRNPAHNLSEE